MRVRTLTFLFLHLLNQVCSPILFLALSRLILGIVMTEDVNFDISLNFWSASSISQFLLPRLRWSLLFNFILLCLWELRLYLTRSCCYDLTCSLLLLRVQLLNRWWVIYPQCLVLLLLLQKSLLYGFLLSLVVFLHLDFKLFGILLLLHLLIMKDLHWVCLKNVPVACRRLINGHASVVH